MPKSQLSLVSAGVGGCAHVFFSLNQRRLSGVDVLTIELLPRLGFRTNSDAPGAHLTNCPDW